MNNHLEQVVFNAKKRDFSIALQQLEAKTVLIYGAGAFGTEMFQSMRKAGIGVAAFLDKNASQMTEVQKPIPIFTAENAPFDRAKSVVLLSIVMDKEERGRLIGWLHMLGYCRIVEAQSLRCLLVQPDDRQERESPRAYYQRRLSDIESAQSLFQDNLSKKLFYNTFFAHATGDYTKCPLYESPMSEQYFPPDIKFAKGYRRFVDCGGYTGDTIEHLIQKEGNIEACTVFEPNSTNFKKMAERLERLKSSLGKRWLFPCAVNGEIAIHTFAQGTGSGMLSQSGINFIQTATIDQTIPDFFPTFIKMDIEGAEFSALQGAKQTIARNTPDLAICLYHTVNHLWDIPLLLHHWNLGYRFYLRNYNAYTMETVLYATAIG